jgi:hypothetical protein
VTAPLCGNDARVVHEAHRRNVLPGDKRLTPSVHHADGCRCLARPAGACDCNVEVRVGEARVRLSDVE